MIQGRQITNWITRWDWPNAKFRYCNPRYVPTSSLGIGRGGKESSKKEYWGFSGDIENHHKPERILIRQTSDSIIACYHSEIEEGRFYTDNTLFSCFSKNEIPLKYFLAFLNSSLYNYVYQYLSAEQGKTLAQVKIGLLEVLPFRHSLVDQDELIGLVDSVIQAAKDGSVNEVKRIEDLIDGRICQIMGISNEAKEILLRSSINTVERD
jgi:hypothetical protein